MANAATLATLRAQALDMADMTNSSSPVAARIDDYINAAASELHDILVNSFEEYVSKVQTITLVSGTESYALPTDYYKTQKMFSLSGGYRFRIPRFNLDELDAYQDQVVTAFVDGTNLRYRVIGNSVMFAPKPSGGTIEHWYFPQFVKLVADGDVIEVAVPIGWEDFVVLTAAARIRVREELDASQLMGMREAARQNILGAAQERDAGEAHRISDNTNRFNYGRRWWR